MNAKVVLVGCLVVGLLVGFAAGGLFGMHHVGKPDPSIPIAISRVHAAPPSPSDPWVVAHGMLSARLALANFDDRGHLALPPNVRNIELEVGANSRDVRMDEGHLEQHPDTFLLAFEPLLDKFAWYVSRNQKPDVRSDLGRPLPNVAVFPFAIVNGAEKELMFNVSAVDGCSSLLDFSDKLAAPPGAATWAKWAEKNCMKTVEKRPVPSVSLWTVIHDWLAERDIAFTKLDVQGYDLQVIESSGDQLRHLRKLSMEVTSDTCSTLYKDAPRCSAVMQQMKSLGFIPTEKVACDFGDKLANCERDYTFERID